MSSACFNEIRDLTNVLLKPDMVHHPSNLIYTLGTQVVTADGRVGVVIKAPVDFDHGYRIRFPDGTEANLARGEVTMLARFKESAATPFDDWSDRIIVRCIIGSRAYGLDDEASDIDRRGIYLPSAERHWSLAGVPEQIDRDESQETYWELQKFLTLALKANPNLLECLHSPLIEFATPLGEELLAMRSCFLSKLVYQTFNGYVLSQFQKMQAHRRNQGTVKPKHVMHLIRLLLSGIDVLRTGEVRVRVSEYRDRLMAIKRGDVSWEDTNTWRLTLHAEFDAAYATTTLPERPDYDRVDAFLIKARRLACEDRLP